MSQILEIDGSVLEGGGQILRISISLSAILGIPVRVINIRAGRSKPGLAAQHLKGIELVGDMCQAKLRGASIGSTEIEFIPGKIRGGHYVADTKTAGSISLLLQVALPCALFADAPVTLDLKGGTNADMAPQIDYMERVFRVALRRFGADFNMTILRRGYFPKGGGHVRIEVTPVRSLRSINLTERGTVKEITGTSFVAGTLPVKLAYMMAEGAKRELSTDAHIHSYQEERQMAPHNCNGIILSASLSSGCVLGSDALGKRGVDATDVGRKAGEELQRALDSGACVDPHTQVTLYSSDYQLVCRRAACWVATRWASAEWTRPTLVARRARSYSERWTVEPALTLIPRLSASLSSGCVLGSDALGKRGVDATDVGRKAGEELQRALDSGACVDPHTQDQLILYMTLAEGRSTVRAGDVTLHTETAIHISQTIAKVQFNTRPEGNHNFIECTGLGLINKNIPQE